MPPESITQASVSKSTARVLTLIMMDCRQSICRVDGGGGLKRGLQVDGGGDRNRTGHELENPSTSVDAKFNSLQLHTGVRQTPTKCAAVRCAAIFTLQRPPRPFTCIDSLRG